MIIPEIIPINRMEDYHTHYLGQVDDGRLFGHMKHLYFLSRVVRLTIMTGANTDMSM
jgi:hypothetical protein